MPILEAPGTLLGGPVLTAFDMGIEESMSAANNINKGIEERKAAAERAEKLAHANQTAHDMNDESMAEEAAGGP